MRRDLVLGIVATAVLVVAGAAAVVALVLRARSSSAPDASRAPIRAALVAADGRHITVVGTASLCTQPQLQADEDDHTVELELTTKPSTAPCPLIAASSTRVVARTVLATALADRRLVDSTSGARVPYFDGHDLRRLTYLPPGWSLQGDFPGPDSDVSANGAPSWIRSYYRSGGLLTVTQSYGVITGSTRGAVVASVRVDGVRVPLHAYGHGYSAAWTDGPMHFTLAVPPTGRGTWAMPRPQVVRVLEGLHG